MLIVLKDNVSLKISYNYLLLLQMFPLLTYYEHLFIIIIVQYAVQ